MLQTDINAEPLEAFTSPFDNQNAHQGVGIDNTKICVRTKRKGSDLDVIFSLNSNKSAKIPYSQQPTIESDDENTSSCSSKSQHNFKHIDGRKLNKGSFHRKSYSIDIKRRAIALRDSGLRIEAISRLLDTAKSNVEKWCSVKVTM